MWIDIKNFILDTLFPKNCFNCKREGDYLCIDCISLLDISGFHFSSSFDSLDDLYWTCNYNNILVKKLIKYFKYEPFVKELSKTFSYLIQMHFLLMDDIPDFTNFNIVAVPLSKKRLKWRNYNQSEELAKELAKFFKIPLIQNNLVKEKDTVQQTKLSIKDRLSNLKDAFYCKNPKDIKNKNILLIDDVYTTGATLKECAKTLKKAGANKIIGIVIARG